MPDNTAAEPLPIKVTIAGHPLATFTAKEAGVLKTLCVNGTIRIIKNPPAINQGDHCGVLAGTENAIVRIHPADGGEITLDCDYE